MSSLNVKFRLAYGSVKFFGFRFPNRCIMEYEVYFGCNIVGALAVLLIFIYHLISTQPLKSIDSTEDEDIDVSLKKRKQL